MATKLFILNRLSVGFLLGKRLLSQENKVNFKVKLIPKKKLIDKITRSLCFILTSYLRKYVIRVCNVVI